MTSKKVIAVLVTLFLIFLCRDALHFFDRDYFVSSSDFADMFINYSGGFVRRGLLGQFFLWCYHVGIDPIWAAAVMSIVSFLIIATYMIVQFKKRGYYLCLLVVGWFLGSMGLFPLTWMRRDYIIMAMFLMVVWLWKKIDTAKWVVLANVLVCVTILSYEPFALFSIPFCILLTNLRLKCWWKSLLAWAFPMLTFLACCKYSGSKDVYDAIVSSTKGFLPKPGIISFLFRDSAEVMKFHIQTNFLTITCRGRHFVLESIVCFPCVLYYCVNAIPVFTQNKADFANRRYILALLMCAFVVLSPMFVCLSTDYARTIVYVVLSSYFLFFTLNDKERSELLPPFVYRIADCLLKYSDKYLRPTRSKVVFIMFFIGIADWAGSGHDYIDMSLAWHLKYRLMRAFQSVCTHFQIL